MIHRVTRGWFVCAVATLLAGQARADLADVVLTVRVAGDDAAGVLQITADQGTWMGEDFSWSTDAPLPIMSGTKVLASFGPGNITVHAGRSVSIGFSLQTSAALTSFTFGSPLLPIQGIESPMARASGAFTLQDFYGAGASFEPRMRCYLADGTVWWQESASLVVVPPDLLAATSSEHPAGGGYEPIPPTSGLRLEVSGTLSPYSLASGSAFFEIIPEPATALLTLLGLSLIRRR